MDNEIKVESTIEFAKLAAQLTKDGIRFNAEWNGVTWIVNITGF